MDKGTILNTRFHDILEAEVKFTRDRQDMASDNIPMFDIENKWQEEWKDMPEFVQEKQEPYATVIVRFSCKEDLDSFAKLIGQKLTPKTKSIWHPFRSHWGNGKRVKYVDES